MKNSTLIILTLILLQNTLFAQSEPVEKDGKYGYVDKTGNLKTV